ncbi:nicotinate-nucleotide adenylyltransferase [Arenibacter sp. F20364]|uniref:nicotinate-nucleotide adenylyltransferase n=1 Tax=Arenibacter sp. F20364 TaxID=2926415 RepID=UPI001FF682A7|nr:nicotinate-nucleotide adenylyltransferase [Arenibacter sp. F20364]MCK0192886.1 nicotinate-nucleotide adenylyltransferase [Arenibacter sp. F20364]
MKSIMLGLFVLGLTAQSFAQIIKTEELSEVIVYATNYKYLHSLVSEEPAPVPVEMLERKVAAFNLKDSEYYQDDYDTYNINFYIPDGLILAAYDKDGKLIRTAERFKDVGLPPSVRAAIADRFPEWTVTKDVYRVYYHEDKGVTKKYKIKLENGDQTIRVKLDEEGNFI